MSTQTLQGMTAEPLKESDRCDRCGAQAYMRATLAAGTELLFCAHHGREHAPKLAADGVRIHDETGQLGW